MILKKLIMGFLISFIIVNSVIAQSFSPDNIAKEYTSKSYTEKVEKVVPVKLEQSETIYVYKFNNPENGNSEYLVLSQDGVRVKDQQKIINSIFSSMTYSFMVKNGAALGNIFETFKSDIESVRDDTPLIKTISTALSRVAEKLSVDINYKFLSINLANIKLENYDQLYNMIDSLRIASETDLKKDPIKFTTDVPRFYANEITLEKGIPDLLKNPSPAVAKLTTDLSDLQKFSIPEKQKEFLQVSQDEPNKIEQRIKNKQEEANLIFSQAQQTNNNFKTKIKDTCLEIFFDRCSRKDEFKSKYNEFKSKILPLSYGDEKFNTYINSVNNTINDINTEESILVKSKDIKKFNLFGWWEKIFF